jgi:hypothetical protein
MRVIISGVEFIDKVFKCKHFSKIENLTVNKWIIDVRAVI